MSDRTPGEVLSYCDVATPGPWKANKGDRSLVIIPGNEEWLDAFFVNYEDAKCCANAREDLPRMAKRVMELEKEKQNTIHHIERRILQFHIAQHEGVCSPTCDMCLAITSLLSDLIHSNLEARDAE